MKFLQKIVLAAALLTLWGCSGGGHQHVEARYAPELYGFYLVDSFGVDSQVDHETPLAIDPEVYDGVFDLYWDVESHSDFRLRIGVNDDPTMRGAQIVGDDLCGWDLPCEEFGGFICQYNSFGEVGCGLDLEEAEYKMESINFLLGDYPALLYVNIEVCNLERDICEVDSLPVDFF